MSTVVVALFNRHYRDLRRYLTRRLGDNDLAEDIAQDAFSNLLQVPDLAEMENPKAYLYKAATHLALNRLRHHRYQRDYLACQSDDEPETSSLFQHLAAERDMAQVQRQLNRLPEKYRRTFLMSRLEHKSYTEIAAEQGLSVSTVEKHIIKALKHLRDALVEEV
jgi:RNA polymerase sigma-70 factor (family 1)